MSQQLTFVRAMTVGSGLLLLALVASTPLPVPQEVAAQQPAQPELPLEFRLVPPDAALFVYGDAPKIWDSPILKPIRKADATTFDKLLGEAKKELGLAPEDLKSVILFIPKVVPRDGEAFGVVLTFTKAFDAAKLQKAAEQLLPRDMKPKVVAASDRVAVVLLGRLKEEYAKPQPAGKTGPLTETLKAAASGKHVGVLGMTLASLPDEIRGDDIPPPVRPFQPLFKAVSISAFVDLGKDATLTIRVKTPTAAQAVECEKSLGALVALVQDELGEWLKDVEKDATAKDLITLMKAGLTAAKGAKFSTLGNETELTVTLPTDLPFAGAYITAKKKIEDAAATASSSNNLKQIGIALHSYTDTNNGTMPPAAACDKNGKPLLSWRVLILPYIEQDALFKEFKLDEPWDSEHNKKLLAKMPKVYAIPGKTKPGDTDTHYRVFVGNGAGFDYIRGARFPADFTDGTSNTLMCATAAEAVPWTKPDELAFDPDKDMGKLLGLVVNGKMQIALFDGSVRSLNKIPDKKTLVGLITRAGGEVIDFPE